MGKLKRNVLKDSNGNIIMPVKTEKPILEIWLCNRDWLILSHNDVINYKNTICAEWEYLTTYDTYFFDAKWLSLFEDIAIIWKPKDNDLTKHITIKEMLDNKCPYIDRQITPDSNLLNIFWSEIYR